MTMEAMLQQWQEQDRRINALLKLNREALRERMTRPLRTSVQRLALLYGAECAATLAALVLNGSFLAGHWNEPRFALPSAAIHAWLIFALITCARLLLQLRAVDYTSPVPEMQRRIAQLRATSLRATKWALLTGQLVWWIPFAIVSAKGALGIDLWAILPGPYLPVSLAAGLFAIPVLVWAARRCAANPISSPVAAWLAHQLAGTQLNLVTRRMAEFAEIEME